MSRFPFSDVGRIDIPAFGSFYTKKEVDKLVQKAVADAVAEAQGDLRLVYTASQRITTAQAAT